MAELLTVRRVRLRVQNVPVALMENYHGRDAGLIGTTVDAVELETAGGFNTGVVAYVDDRDGEASELAEAVLHARSAGVPNSRYERDLEGHAKRRFLHGEVIGVRT